MDNARLKRILTIVDTTLSLDPKKREGYLTEVCGDDEILKEEVVKLLKSIDTSERFWEDWQNWNKQQINRLLQEPEKDRTELEKIGPWRLIKLLGRGGMGSVYLAERADRQYEQQVAVKLLQRGLETGESVRRFEQERQILAKLDHPNIAGLYDGGITEDGRSWLAMQYVDGASITKWCKQNNTSLQQRLELFQKVCEAVRYAHRNLIVHRDLKPENILVTKGGSVKVLDFGIAKLLDQELSESQRLQTQTGLRVMSLDYAAPEQITGEAVTTATDVYALGLLLYKLLTQKYPFNLQGKNQRKVEQILRNEDPPKPSSVAVSWQAGLRGDLDAITMKALRKEPEQRYENAGQILEDIERYHLNQPVSARRDTLRYRMGKFYKRHRAKLAAAMIVLIGVVSLVTYYTLQLSNERNKARQEAAKAEEVSSFLEDLFNASDPILASESDRLDTLQVREFLKRGAAKAQNDLHDQPLVQARMLNVVGDVYFNLGLFDDALALLEQALSIRRNNGEPLDIAETLESMALTLYQKGIYDMAEQYYREALQLRKSYQGDNNIETAQTMVNLATLLAEKSAYNESETLFRQALTAQEAITGENSIEMAETYRKFGMLFHHRADLDQAEFYYRKALALYRTKYGMYNLNVVQSLLNMATVLREKGRYDEAEPLIQEVVEIRKTMLGETHPLTVTSIYELAILLRDNKDPKLERAAELLKAIVELDKKQLGVTHHFVGLDLFELGITFNKMENFKEAAKFYRESLAVLRKALPNGHPDIAKALIGLGDTLIKDGKPAQAEPLLRESLQIRIDKLGEQAWRTGVSKSALGWAIMMQGRYNEAEPLLLSGYTTLRDNNGPTQAALKRLVMLYEFKDQPDFASKYQNILAKAEY